ncbi:MAG: serine--tRNA ligase [Deltaproteobacteria bacterium RIFCSPHIGHO2_12_FULL_43_9]|nr:MAG: serine--tRNA ligase [Deltaproteobacteria bacterium RIFCSPHIGHO2_12_FULL_43_9]
MLDIRYVVENLEEVTKRLSTRGTIPPALKQLKDLDSNRRKSIQKAEAIKQKKNEANELIAKKKKSKESVDDILKKMKEFSEEEKALAEDINKLSQQLTDFLLHIPNLPHKSVTIGKSSEENKIVRTWGEKPKFPFKPKDHVELGEKLKILDFERASKISGARFPLYMNQGARLERALLNFMLDVQTKENKYTECLPPFMVSSTSLQGTGQLPKFKEDLFKIENFDLYLVPTAEVPVTNIYRDEILDENELPKKFTAFTPCFRSEAGSYGKDVKGLIRNHQFNKVELVKFTTPETSYDELESLTKDAESILQKLNLHYRVVELCTGDLGFASAKTYDIEVWLPSQNAYREISSCSNFEDYQARRAKIRFKRKGEKKTNFVHTLNGSGLAIGRTWVAIIEQYQQPDGSIKIPDALVPYMDGAKVIPAKAGISSS